jgi:hypothetical protein
LCRREVKVRRAVKDVDLVDEIQGRKAAVLETYPQTFGGFLQRLLNLLLSLYRELMDLMRDCVALRLNEVQVLAVLRFR